HVGNRRAHPGGKIEFRAERIVVQDSVRDAIAHAEVKRNRGVNRHVPRAIAEPIRIPEWEDRSVAKQWHRLLAESIVASARRIAENVSEPSLPHARARRLDEKLVTRAIGDAQAHRMLRGADDQSFGVDEDGIARLTNDGGAESGCGVAGRQRVWCRKRW